MYKKQQDSACWSNFSVNGHATQLQLLPKIISPLLPVSDILPCNTRVD